MFTKFPRISTVCVSAYQICPSGQRPSCKCSASPSSYHEPQHCSTRPLLTAKKKPYSCPPRSKTTLFAMSVTHTLTHSSLAWRQQHRATHRPKKRAEICSDICVCCSLYLSRRPPHHCYPDLQPDVGWAAVCEQQAEGQ